MLHDQEVTGVALATPAETHFYLAREAILAGKHVYVEKPLTLEEEDAEELIKLAADSKRVLMIGHLLHYHPGFIKLKELAATGELGRINYIYSHRLNLGKIRREENILWSFAPHDISMILSLAGEEPEQVEATGGYYLHKKIADVTTTHLDFPSGLKAHIFVSWLHPFKEQKLVVVGDKKMAVFDDTKSWEEKLLLYAHRINWEQNVPVPTKAEPERVQIEQNEPLRCECEHFLKCMAKGERPRTDGQEGLRVLKIFKAAQEALDNGHKSIGHRVKNRQQNSEIYFTQIARQTDHSNAHSEDSSMPFVHETAVVDEPSEIGAGTKIWHFSHVLKNSRIGEMCNVGQNVVIGPDVSIGKQCKIQNNVSVYKGVTLEDGVFCGPSMVFTNIYNPRAEMSKMDQVRQTLVKKGATLGANSTIVCGTTIGTYAFVGAGAVGTQNIPDHALMVGNPARRIGWMCECGERLSDDLECLECGKRFVRRNGDGLRRRNNGERI